MRFIVISSHFTFATASPRLQYRESFQMIIYNR